MFLTIDKELTANEGVCRKGRLPRMLLVRLFLSSSYVC